MLLNPKSTIGQEGVLSGNASAQIRSLIRHHAELMFSLGNVTKNLFKFFPVFFNHFFSKLCTPLYPKMCITCLAERKTFSNTLTCPHVRLANILHQPCVIRVSSYKSTNFPNINPTHFNEETF